MLVLYEDVFVKLCDLTVMYMAAAKKIITRLVFDCPIFGKPKDFSLNKLLTGEDVIWCGLQEKYVSTLKTNNINISILQVAGKVANKIIGLKENLVNLFSKSLLSRVRIN